MDTKKWILILHMYMEELPTVLLAKYTIFIFCVLYLLFYYCFSRKRRFNIQEVL